MFFNRIAFDKTVGAAIDRPSFVRLRLGILRAADSRPYTLSAEKCRGRCKIKCFALLHLLIEI